MTGKISNEHQIDPLTRVCMGCGKAAGAAKTVPECPAYYRRLQGLLIIVTTAEKLMLVVPGQLALRLDQAEMFEVRDAVDEGVNQLREQGRSTAFTGD